MPSKPHRPPGPRGLPFLGVALAIRKNGLGVLLRSTREFGDIVYIPLMFGQSRIFLNHPEWIEQVLVLQQHKFHKSEFAQDATRRLLGNGLLNSEGEFWRRQRRLAQPAFQKARIAEYAPVMIEQALAHTSEWREGDVRDMAGEMSRLTCGIAVKTLFGMELGSQADRVGQELTFLMRYQMRCLRSPFRWRQKLPLRENRRADRAYRYLDSVVYKIIEARRARGREGNDLLSHLIAAMDRDGSQMTPGQLRDETMTLFLAGHETTALTLAWTWYLLAQNPAVEARLEEELSRILRGREPRPEDAESLPYLHAVIRESLRLYPPAYGMGRLAMEPFELGGYRFPAGTTVLIAPWVTHRDARYFSDPLVFRPERWMDGLAGRLPAHAYFPFGGGPRRCIGQGFALLEATLVAATLAQRFRFTLAEGRTIAIDPLVTLRPRGQIRMTIHRRERSSEARAAS